MVLKHGYIKKLYGNFCNWLHEEVFSDQVWLNHVEKKKALKMKVKVTDIFGATSNLFLIFRNYKLFRFGVNTS